VTEASLRDFQEAIRPAVEGVENFRFACTTVLNRHDRKAVVTARCPAMTELQNQSTYKGTKDNQPVDNVVSMIRLLAEAGNDALRAVVVLANTDPVFIWAHLPSARSALETFAYCHWLAECPLDPDRRVQRGLLMQLEDAKELARFGIETFTNQSQKTKASIQAFSEANEWPVSFTKMTIGREVLIDTKPAIDLVVGGTGDIHGLAPQLWSYLSGASHGNPYALLQSADRTGGVIEGPMITVPLVVEASTIHNLTATLILAGIRAWGMTCRYFGWDDEDWRASLTPVREYLDWAHEALRTHTNPGVA
jgi:hypothetical protein